ncbi:MAG TPA: phosphodiester glycosidase family protein [bacterium]|nr:phosphodiester glycosidase family protein [bacterium]
MRSLTGARGRLLVGLLLVGLFFSTIPGFSEEQVGPGLFYSEIVQQEMPWQIRVLRLDLNSPHLQLEGVLSQDGILSGLEKASHISRRLDREDAPVAAAVNADFWGAHRDPLGMTVIDGEIVRSPSERSVFVVKEDGTLLIDEFKLRCYIERDKATDTQVVGINRWDNENGALLFNHWIGSKVPTTEQGAGWVLNPNGKKLESKCLIPCTVESAFKHEQGGTPMPSDRIVLWFPKGQDPGIQQGEEISIDMNLEPDYSPIKLAVGGGPRIVRDGEPVAGDDNFSTVRHPRTAVGFSQDGKELILLAVDGRRAGWSIGMSLWELGQKMRELGCWQAMNLDGGGSTTMVLWHEVKNRPSDNTGERSVANCLLVRSTAPRGKVEHISLKRAKVHLLPASTFKMDIIGTDRFHQPVSIDDSTVRWSTPRGWFYFNRPLGTISKSGLLRAGSRPAEGVVTAKVNGLETSVRVVVERPKWLQIEPEQLDLPLGRDKQITVTALGSDGIILSGTPGDLQFTMKGDCGEVDQNGLFRPLKQGQGTVVVRLGGMTAEIPVNVSETYKVLLEDFEDCSDWTVTKARADETQCGLIETREHLKFGDKTGKLFYKLERGGISCVYMETDKSWEGTAEAAEIWIYGDGSGHMLRAELFDDQNNVFLVDLVSAVDWSGEWKQVHVSLLNPAPHWSNPTAKMGRLCRWKNIYLAETKEDKKNSGAIFFDDLEVITVPPAK